MNCPNCHQPFEAGAAFCGNCGKPLAAPTGNQPQPPAAAQSSPPAGSPIAQVMQAQPTGPTAPQTAGPLVAVGSAGAAAGIPSYALAVPGQHSADEKALLALLFGIAGIIGALFMVLIGLALGIAGIVMGTLSRSSSKRGLSTAGLIVSSVAVLASLAFWAYAASQELKQNASNGSHNATGPAVSASKLSTPCYSANFSGKLNITNSANSCDMTAFNGATQETSSDAYKIYAATSQIAQAGNFTSVVKPAIEKDIQDNLPSFTVDNEGTAEFAGSPAYMLKASNQAQHVAVVEAAIFHPVAHGENVFIMVHAVSGDNVDLHTLEGQWQWK